jgi:hypothetical protein
MPRQGHFTCEKSKTFRKTAESQEVGRANGGPVRLLFKLLIK